MRKPSPFDLPPDLDGQKNALTTALQIVQGFALYFVVSEPSRVRPRLMDEVETRLTGKTTQRVVVPPGSVNLLHVLQERLSDPLPDVVFVYGLESSVYGAAEARSHPLLLNLNATRNNLYAVLPRPVVLWVPLFVLKAITDAAPDFISVRSGVYSFPLDREERRQMDAAAAALGQTQVLSLGHSERAKSIAEMQALLSEYRSLPLRERDPLDEARILNRLGESHNILGGYAEAEPLLVEALAIRRKLLPVRHPDTATSLNNLAALYYNRGRYAEAEPLYVEALAIYRETLPAGHPDIASSLNNLAGFYNNQGRHAEAEPLYNEALAIYREALPASHPYIASSLNNLAALYEAQNRHAEAEPLSLEALAMRRKALPAGHPSIATSLNNLAGLYNNQGRHAEAEPLYNEALELVRKSLEDDHPNRKIVEDNVAEFKWKKTTRDESLRLPSQN